MAEYAPVVYQYSIIRNLLIQNLKHVKSNR